MARTKWAAVLALTASMTLLPAAASAGPFLSKRAARIDARSCIQRLYGRPGHVGSGVRHSRSEIVFEYRAGKDFGSAIIRRLAGRQYYCKLNPVDGVVGP
jgi:hypothetical protein